MAITKLNIILDTNWYISATINKKSRRLLYQLLMDTIINVLFSDEILKEYNQVINRDKFKRIIIPQQVTRFINLVISKAQKIEVTSYLKGSRDLKDNFLLSLSHDAHADYLITGDKDLLTLAKTGLTKIVTMGDFLILTFHKTQ